MKVLLLLFPIMSFAIGINEKNLEAISEKYKNGIKSAIENPSLIKSYLYRKNIEPFKEIPSLLELKEIKDFIKKKKSLSL